MYSDQITDVVCYHLSLPLELPYRWRGGLIEYFDAIVVEVSTVQGYVGIGEATPVAGYSFEDTNDVWEYVTRQASVLIDTSAQESLDKSRKDILQHPFGCAAVRGALENAVRRFETLPPNIELPVVGTVRASAGVSETEAALRLVKDGYRTLKLKIGNDVEHDLERIQTLQKHLPDVQLRLDANQGYTLVDAEQFLLSVNPDLIELIEQPLHRDDWDGQARLNEISTVPLMLDEAVWTDDDIRRASEVSSIIKLKVMKSGGSDSAVRQAMLAQDLGLDVVIGNGVATEIDALAEARVQLQAELRLPGEFNGFAKQASPIVLQPPVLEDGVLCGYELTTAPELNMDSVDRHCRKLFRKP